MINFFLISMVPDFTHFYILNSNLGSIIFLICIFNLNPMKKLEI